MKLMIHFSGLFMYNDRPEKRFGQNWIKNWLCAWPNTWKTSPRNIQVDQKYLPLFYSNIFFCSTLNSSKNVLVISGSKNGFMHEHVETSSNNPQVDQKYLVSVRWENWLHFNLVLLWKFFVLRIRKDKRKWKTFWGWIEWVLNLKVFPVDT